MAKLVQQSTANDPLFFFLVLSSDHISPATGKTPTVTISKNGAAFATPTGAVSEIANGWYQVAGNATDTNTLGDILLHATEATSDNSDLVAAQVVAFNPRNANLGLSNVSANVAQWNGTNVSAPATAGIPDVNVKNYNNQTAATDANNLPKVDVEDINGNATAAQNVSKANQAIGRGTAGAGGALTSITTSAWSPGGAGVVSGQFIGRTVIFDATTATAALQGQATNITANTAGATPTFTVTALTTIPASGDTFGVY
jgi:hypothetical protein